MVKPREADLYAPVKRFLETQGYKVKGEHIDVSSFKEVAVRWMNEAQVYEKQGSHRAMGDIKDSVGELKFYKKLFLPEG